MTYIPGTGQPKDTVPAADTPHDFKKSEMFSVVNVENIKHPEKKDEPEDTDVWYNQLKYWMILGGIISFLFGLMAFINWRSLFLVPLGPYALYLSWHIRKRIKRSVKRFDVLS